jgi:hypothetical protein
MLGSSRRLQKYRLQKWPPEMASRNGAPRKRPVPESPPRPPKAVPPGWHAWIRDQIHQEAEGIPRLQLSLFSRQLNHQSLIF